MPQELKWVCLQCGAANEGCVCEGNEKTKEIIRLKAKIESAVQDLKYIELQSAIANLPEWVEQRARAAKEKLKADGK